ncbi:hypothetical protein FRB96_002644 [Tulasnella sp. 330]|nr:hypothetical protein FRB96_002644 [Tulasnella sp. 330]KAG8882863.1 hypothetical protein FRB98_003414 [Tulasnella sp. 332]
MAQNAKQDVNIKPPARPPLSSHQRNELIKRFKAIQESTLSAFTAKTSSASHSQSDLDHFANIFSTFERRAAQDILLERAMSSGYVGNGQGSSSGSYGGGGWSSTGSAARSIPAHDDFQAFLNSLGEQQPHQGQSSGQNYPSSSSQPPQQQHGGSTSQRPLGSSHGSGGSPPQSWWPSQGSSQGSSSSSYFPAGPSQPQSSAYTAYPPSPNVSPVSPSHWNPQANPPNYFPASPAVSYPAALGVPPYTSQQEAQTNIQLQMMYLQWQQQQLQAALVNGTPQIPPTLPPLSSILTTSPASPVSPQRRRSSQVSSPEDRPEFGERDRTGSGSPTDQDKRRKNTEASARFRQKRKERVQGLGKSISELETKAQELEREATTLRTENDWLKGMVVMKGRSNLALQNSGQTGEPSRGLSQADDAENDDI